MSESFFSNDYEAPKGESRYMKLQDGENRIRILGKALVANELWVNGKPVRTKSMSEFTQDQLRNADINKMTGVRSTPKEILAFPVYNYDQASVQILQIGQVTIMRELERLFKDEDWGDPQGYGLVINRNKTGQKVSYSVSPKPKNPLKPEVEAAWEEVKSAGFDINKLLTGENPFGAIADSNPEGEEEETSSKASSNDIDNGDI